MGELLRVSCKKILLLALLIPLLSACREELIHDLSEGDVNRVVSRLHKGGISAEKAQQADGRWSVSVSREDMVGAISLLDTSRVLARRAVGDERKGKGSFIPSREEQWFQYESQVAESLEATLLTLPGVVDAHVHLKLPPSDPLLGTRDAGQGSGSVLLILENDSRAALVHEGDIAKVVAGGAGIPVDRVRVLKSSASGAGEENLGSFGIASAKSEDVNLPEEAKLISRASDVEEITGAVPQVALVKSYEPSVADGTNLIATKAKLPYSELLTMGAAVGAGLLCLCVVFILLRRSRKKREIFALRKNDLLGEIA